MMFKESIPCCYFPTKVIMIDDNADFSNNLSLAFGKEFHSESFVSPNEALTYLKNNGEFMKTLLTKYISVSEHYIPSAVTVDVNVASLCKEIYNQHVRFDRPVVLIVDYAMPEMNGLKFCEELSGLPYKKIVLTGEADNDFAVEAFNLGQIDRFVKKGEADYIAKIKSYVQELNIQYFSQLSQSVFDLLSKNGHDVLHSEVFIKKFNEILAKHNIVEFYLADDTGSYMLLDEKGNAMELVVRTEEDMFFFAELAENDGMQSMAEAITARQKMPRLLVGGDRSALAESWELCDANALHDGDTTYYYSVIGGSCSDKQAKEKPLSYHQYLYGDTNSSEHKALWWDVDQTLACSMEHSSSKRNLQSEIFR